MFRLMLHKRDRVCASRLILGGRPFGHESVNPLEVFEVGEIDSDLAVFATDGYPHRRLQMLGKKAFEFE